MPDGEVGELFYRTPMLFKEYLKEPEKTKEAFIGEWSSAGDMVKRDEDGYYTLVDRKANMIITGGENVYPVEVENVLTTHPQIADAAVIGVAHPKWGEAPLAILVCEAGATIPADEELAALCREHLAAFKVPKYYHFTTELPRNPSGKVLKQQLRDDIGKHYDE